MITTQEQVIELIANFMDLPVSFVEPDTELAELRIDSLDKAGISLEIDRKFNHTITDRELSRMTHVRDFINSVKKSINNG